MIAGYGVWRFRHVIAEVLMWAGVAVGLVLAVAAAFITFRRFRRSDQPKRVFWRPPGRQRWLRHVPRALWCAARWHHLTRNLGLAYPDKHVQGKVRRPRAIVHPSRHGVTARVRTVPDSGREEFDRAAEHIGNAWRVQRVSVSQPRPGRLVVRGLRSDPLTEPLTRQVLAEFDGRHVVLGRDERGKIRSADLANLSGSAFSGSPGRGKTEAALSLAVQLAPSPLVDTWILDGGSCDWQPFADGVAGYVGDDLAAAADMLALLDVKMGDRRRNLQRDRGARNGWTLGPSPDYRLQWVLVEEAPFYLDLEAVRGDRNREQLVRTCRGLLAGLLRRGRAPLFHTTLIAQKGTGTGGLPPDLRDLCGLRWSFGVATTEAAAAILGDDIRQHPTRSPVQLQGAGHVGVASVLFGGKDPYTLVRFPAIGQARADELAAALTDNVTVPGPDPAARSTPAPDGSGVTAEILT
jgi:S-DNA-T family DNA segregation ATPase FtsK/SpoIIIE